MQRKNKTIKMETKKTIQESEYRQNCRDCALYHNGACTSWRGHNFKHGGAYCEYFENKNIKNIEEDE